METRNRRSEAVLNWLSHIAQNPYPYSFNMAMRVIECAHADRPRIGDGITLQDECIKLAQPAFLHHPGSQIAKISIATDDKNKVDLSTYLFGLLGPNGPLPHHITDYIRHRKLAKDNSPSEFINLFHQRFLSYYYRTWSDTEPVTQFDRPDNNIVNQLLGSMSGIPDSSSSLFPKHAEYYYAGHLSRPQSTTEGLLSILRNYFTCRFTLQRFTVRWANAPQDDYFILSHKINLSKQLGQNTQIGKRIRTAQHEFNLSVYPKDFNQYNDFINNNNNSLATVCAIVKRCLGLSFSWRLTFVLPEHSIPAKKLGENTRLDKKNWLFHDAKKTACKHKKAVSLSIDPNKYLSTLSVSRSSYLSI